MASMFFTPDEWLIAQFPKAMSFRVISRHNTCTRLEVRVYSAYMQL